MKLLIRILSIFAFTCTILPAYCQYTFPSNPIIPPTVYNALKVEKLFWMAVPDTSGKMASTYPGALVYQRSNKTFYISDSTIWQPIPFGIGDSLAQRLTVTQADAKYKPIEYTPTWTEVTGKPTTFAPSAHTHLASQVTDFTSAGRGLISGTSPISYNSGSGAIGWTGTTTDVPEGMRLYFSNARVQTFADTRYTPLVRAITPGIGMTGGGDLTADRPINLDFSYLDDRYLSGYKQRPAVRVATTANITLSGTQTIDGVVVVAGDRVLVKNQSTASQNGIYIVAASAWSRAADFDAATPGEIEQGSQIFVQEGTANNKTGWSLSTGGTIVVGTTNLSFIQYAGANSYAAGVGLTLGGNTFSAQNTTALWNANKLQGIGLSTTLPTTSQLLRYDGTNYTPWTPDYLTGELDMVAQGKTVTVNAGTGISVSGGTQSLSSNPAFTVSLNATTSNVPEGSNMYWTNARGDSRYPLLSGSYNNPSWLTGLSYSKITGTPTTLAGAGITDAIQNQFSAVSPGSYWIDGVGRMAMINTNAASGTAHQVFLNPGGNSTRWAWFLNGAESTGNAGSDLVLNRYNDAGTLLGTSLSISRATSVVNFGTNPTSAGNQIWNAANHVAGSAFSPTLTGASVLNSLASNASGHITALTTRTLTASDIAAAPAAGSANYIQNNNASAQTANGLITGNFGAGEIRSSIYNSNNSAGVVNIFGGAVGNFRGAEIALRGGTYTTTPGELTFHTGIAGGGVVQSERMRIDKDGFVSIPYNLVVGVGTGNAAPLVVSKSVPTGVSTTTIQNLNNSVGTYGLVVNTANTDATTTPFSVRSNGDDKFKVLGNGNVGIAHLAPTARLDIGVSGAVELGFTGTGTANILHQTTGQPIYINTNTGQINLGANGSGSQHLTIINGGNIGVGTTTPGNKLQVSGAVSSTGDLSASVANSMNMYVSGGTGRLTYINPSGAVGAQMVVAGDSILFSADKYRVVGRLITGGTSDDGVNTIQAAGGSIRSGGLVLGSKVITASYTATISDYTIYNRATGGNPTLTLPSASNNVGRVYYLKDEAGTPNMMTISPGIRFGGVTYTSFNNPAFMNGPKATIQSDGTYWQVQTN